MARTLDRSQDFGTICGTHEAAFIQDGVFFDINGDEIGESSEPQEAPKNKGGRPPKKVEAAPTDEIQAQIDANLAG